VCLPPMSRDFVERRNADGVRFIATGLDSDKRKDDKERRDSRDIRDRRDDKYWRDSRNEETKKIGDREKDKIEPSERDIGPSKERDKAEQSTSVGPTTKESPEEGAISDHESSPLVTKSRWEDDEKDSTKQKIGTDKMEDLKKAQAGQLANDSTTPPRGSRWDDFEDVVDKGKKKRTKKKKTKRKSSLYILLLQPR